MQAVCHVPDTFVLIEESFFSLKKAKILQEYCLGTNIFSMLIVEYLLQKHKHFLIAVIITDPYILSQEVFPPATINPMDLCNTFLCAPIPWTPPI